MKLAITGQSGRMGQILLHEIGQDGDLSSAGELSRDMSDDDIKDVFLAADAVIDFTLPEGTERHVRLALETKTPIIVATTGLSKDQEAMLGVSAKLIPVIYASNTSIGVTLLQSLVEKVAGTLGPEFDIEIMESHHKYKIDAPSGTALSLGKAAQKGRGAGEFVTEREGQRKSGDIGYAVQRGGDVTGEHMVTFYGDGERIELGHRASNKSLFAKGALRAARWIKDQKPGLYTMRDVLGF